MSLEYIVTTNENIQHCVCSWCRLFCQYLGQNQKFLQTLLLAVQLMHIKALCTVCYGK